LHVLDHGSFRHPADGREVRCPVLFVSTATVSLTAEVAASRLLPALRYRIEGFSILLPPLRDRSDLDALARRFVRAQGEGFEIDPSALNLLARHDWPGNLHELRSIIANAVIQASGPKLRAENFAPFLPISHSPQQSIQACPQCSGVPWKESQCRVIRDAVRQHGGIAQAARTLGISRTTIYKH